MYLSIENNNIGTLLSLYAKAARKKISADSSNLATLELGAKVSNIAIDREHLYKFQNFFGLDAGGKILAPYAYILAQKAQLWFLTRPQFAFKPMGMVHLGISFKEFASIDRAKNIDLELKLHSVRLCKPGIVFEISADFSQDNSVVITMNNVYFNRFRSTSSEPLPSLYDFVTEFAAGNSSELAYRQKRIRRYAFLSKDINPIHLSAPSARAFGFKRAIVHGMYNVCSVYSVLHDFGAELVAAPHQSIFAFKSAVFIPSSADLNWQLNNGLIDLALSNHERSCLFGNFAPLK